MEPKVLATRAAAGLVLVAVAALAVPAVRHLREQPPPPAPPIRLSLALPAEAELGSGDDTLDAAISPDERELAFVASVSGTPSLWRQPLAEATATRLAGTEGARYPAWARDGRAIAYFAAGRLKEMSLEHGTVSDLGAAPSPGGMAAMPDGSLLVAGDVDQPLQRLMGADRRPATALQSGYRRHLFPAPVGDDGDFVYIAMRDDGRPVVRLVAGGRERELTATSGHAVVVNGRLVHVRDGALVADPLELTDPPTPRATLGLNVGVAGGHGFFAASPRLLVYAASVARSQQIEWLNLDTGGRTPIRDPGEYWRVRLGPDDRDVAVTMTEPLLRTLDVVTLPTTSAGSIEKVSLALAADADPVWSPEGGRILFRSLQGGRAGLLVRPVHRPDDPPEPMPASDQDPTPTDWRGQKVLASVRGAGTGSDIWELDAGTLAGRPVVNTGFNETDARWSADGRWVLYVSDESGRPDIYTTRLADAVRVRVSFGGGTQPRWGRDGRTIFFLRDGSLMRSSLDDRTTPSALAPERASELTGIRDFDVARRSARLLLLRGSSSAAPPTVSVILDWAGLLPPTPPNARRLRQ